MLINSLRKFYDADKKLRLTFAEDKAREDFISQNITTESILMLGWLMQTKQHFLSAFLVLLHSAPDRTIAILKKFSFSGFNQPYYRSGYGSPGYVL